MEKQYIYEKVKDSKRLTRREAKSITCKICEITWLIRSDRSHSGLCTRCKVTDSNNPMWGKIPYNKGIKTYNDLEYKKVYYQNKRKDNRARAIAYLGNKCEICEMKNLPICCYDIHHKNPNEKEINVSQVFAYSWERVLKELQKCILLCAHCHRILHNGDERLE